MIDDDIFADIVPTSRAESCPPPTESTARARCEVDSGPASRAMRDVDVGVRTAALRGRASRTCPSDGSRRVTFADVAVPEDATNHEERIMSGFSAKYDPSIVFAIDEVLTRGSYSVLAKWFLAHVTQRDVPGCVTVVGYSRVGGDDDSRMVDLGGRESVPFVSLPAESDYPIFDFKRSTGFPAVVILLTLRASRLSHALSCDGRIEVHPRDSLRRSCRRISDAVEHVVDRYLNDFFHDEKRGLCDNDRTGDDVWWTVPPENEIEKDARVCTPERVVHPDEDVVRGGVPMDEMLLRNRRILTQSREGDEYVSGIYPTSGEESVLVPIVTNV